MPRVRSRFLLCGNRIHEVRGLWTNDMDEWVSCADGVRGNTDAESDAFTDAFAHGCANTVAYSSADSKSHAEPNAVANAAVLAR